MLSCVSDILGRFQKGVREAGMLPKNIPEVDVSEH